MKPVNPGPRKFHGHLHADIDCWPGDMVETHGTVWRMNSEGKWFKCGSVYTVTPAKPRHMVRVAS